MKIGSYETQGNIFLAPMAGVTDLPFRLVCGQYGASLLYTEMINAKAVCYEDKNTFEMLRVENEEKAVAVQIFGNDVDFLSKAAEILTELNRFVLIDINMGCPAPKVIKSGEGSAIMKNPQLAFDIVEKVKQSTNLPVTVKFRKGWDNENINAIEFGKILQSAGADAVTIHGRTRAQYYSGNADWDIIKKLKTTLEIPVIANGDIFSIIDAKNILNHTNADAIMIARGAQGNPFIFREINNYFNNEEDSYLDLHKEKVETAIYHYKLALKYKNEHKAVTEMRKHIGWYLKGLKNSTSIKEKINRIYDPLIVIEVLTSYLESLT